MHGLGRLQNDLGTRALFVALFVLALLFLAAIVAPPARADLAGATGESIDQVSEVVETTNSTATNDGTTVTDDGTSPEDGASGGEESNPARPQQVVADVVPPVAHKAVGVFKKFPPVDDDAITGVMDAPLVVEEVLDVTEAALPVVEDLLTVADVAPVVELVEDAQPFVEIFDEVRPVVADVVIMAPPEVVDVVRVLPLFVPTADAIEVPTVPVISTISPRDSVLASQTIKDGSQQLSGLFTKELVAEMTLFHLTDLTDGSAAGGSTSPMPEPETAGLAAYVPIAGTVPVVGGAGASSSTGSSHSGSSSFAGLDAFSFFAAIAALLALCLVGLIRDRSRSGRSVFPTHGGRPG